MYEGKKIFSYSKEPNLESVAFEKKKFTLNYGEKKKEKKKDANKKEDRKEREWIWGYNWVWRR